MLMFLITMRKPYKEIIFRPIEGTWQDVAGDSGTLAENLERYGLIIDDNCEFALIKKNGYVYCYRAYTPKVVLSIWKSTQ